VYINHIYYVQIYPKEEEKQELHIENMSPLNFFQPLEVFYIIFFIGFIPCVHWYITPSLFFHLSSPTLQTWNWKLVSVWIFIGLFRLWVYISACT